MLQGRNGYLLSIGWKDRFLVVNAKKNKQNRNQRKMKPLCTQGYGLKTSKTLHTKMETYKNMLGHKPACK